jgi:hypothetical protein
MACALCFGEGIIAFNHPCILTELNNWNLWSWLPQYLKR